MALNLQKGLIVIQCRDSSDAALHEVKQSMVDLCLGEYSLKYLCSEGGSDHCLGLHISGLIADPVYAGK